ncbi:MAG: hypothetical protein ACOH2I_01130 [Pseudomonas sp.]
MKKSQPLYQQTSPSHGQITTDSQAPTKIARVLEHMIFSGALNRFEAERIGDHCLHSTISSLAHGYGITFTRTQEKVPNHWGLPCDVTRYSLPDSERRRANEVLLLLSKRGNAQSKVAA